MIRRQQCGVAARNRGRKTQCEIEPVLAKIHATHTRGDASGQGACDSQKLFHRNRGTVAPTDHRVRAKVLEQGVMGAIGHDQLTRQQFALQRAATAKLLNLQPFVVYSNRRVQERNHDCIRSLASNASQVKFYPNIQILNPHVVVAVNSRAIVIQVRTVLVLDAVSLGIVVDFDHGYMVTICEMNNLTVDEKSSPTD